MKLDLSGSTYFLRPITPDDQPVLLDIYACTRQSEMDLLHDWTQQQKQDFIRQQFDAQHTHYQKHYSGALFQLILQDSRPIGRLYWIQYPDDIRIIDIALLPNHQGKGIGTMLLSSIQKIAGEANKSVSIHVEIFNPALKLYEGLGFKRIEVHGVYHFMVWKPNT